MGGSHQLDSGPASVALVITGERGAAALIVAAVLLIFLGFAALALDGGNLYQERRDAQNAADQVALAAAFTECDGGTEAEAIAAGLAASAANGYDDADAAIGVTVTREASGRYRATVTIDVAGSFSRALGAADLGTGATAVVSCTDGAVAGTTLHAHGNSCPPELLVSGDSVEVNGGSHSNGDFVTTGETIVYNDGATNGGQWIDTADSTTVSPNVPGDGSGSSTEPWPYEYDITDYDDASDHPGFWYGYTGDTELVDVTIDAGVHYVDGDLLINDITVNPVAGETGVTFVVTGQIVAIPDILVIEPYSGANGLLMFSNHETVCDGNLDDDLAIDSRVDVADYDGVIFAPRGKILLQSDGALAVALWGRYVELRGDPNITLSFPDTAPESDPEIQFEE